MKILLLDIETAPNVAYVWGLFKVNVAVNQIARSGYTLCWSAKWLGEEGTFFDSIYDSGERQMLLNIHNMLEEADVVIHYNGTRFDIPTLNKEFIKHGIKPPSSYKQIDLLRVVRKEFRFTSNKLEYVSKALGVKGKIKHNGFEMWTACMADDPKGWAAMKEYNIGDVDTLEEVYNKLLPWIKNHPNTGLYKNLENVCPNCGSVHVVKRGFAYTGVSKFQRFVCKTCGAWSRNKTSQAVKNILVPDKY